MRSDSLRSPGHGRPGRAAAPGLLASAEPLQEKHLHRPRVLIADDHEEFRTISARLLESEFEVVKAVSDGQALIDAAASLDPDVLVLDISMPGMDGIEAARQVGLAGSRAKIVFLTVHQDPE